MRPVVPETPHKINDAIREPKVRLVREGQEPIVILTREALALAQAEELDLVMIAEKADPPVCKIIDYKSSSTTRRRSKRRLRQRHRKLSSRKSDLAPKRTTTITNSSSSMHASFWKKALS